MLVDPNFVELTDEQVNSIVKYFQEHNYDFTPEEVRDEYTPERIDRGLYMAKGYAFNFNHSLPDAKMDLSWPPQPQIPGYWYEFPRIEDDRIPSYGVCDSPTQFMNKIGKVLDQLPDEYVVGFTEVSKNEQPSEGGWRWHKWGPYIGEQDPQCEYLYNEPSIDKVFVFEILKRVKS